VGEETKSIVSYCIFEILNLKASGKQFASFFKENFPESYKTLQNKNSLENPQAPPQI